MTQEKRENFMFTNDTIFYKKLWSLMLPMMLQNLMLALVAVADAFMLGGMDQNYMSAVSLATQIQFIQNMLLSAATGGLAILGAQYWGRGNIKTLDDIFCMALRLCGLVSIAFFIACICFPQYLMLFFTDEPVLIGYGVQYLRIAGFSYLLTGISQCYLVVMKISEHALTTALISSATVGINIALNAILIYGKLGITPMGVRGAATATLSARMIELACCILISSRPGYIRPYLTRLFQRNQELARDFRKCAMPILGASLFWGVGFTSYSSFMGHLGVDAAAANSVAAVVRDIICWLSAGISGAAGIMVGNELGAGNLKRGKLYGTRMMKISFVCGVAMMVLMGISAPFILYFVKLTPQAAIVDGANLLQQIWYVELPAIKDIIVIQFILQAGNIMSIGFEKAYALQTDMNLPASEILSTYVYRIGLLNGDYGYSTAVGLFNSVINVILLIFVNWVVKKLNDGEGL